MRHIIKLYPVFLLLVVNPLFSQTEEHQLDSIENWLNKGSKEERIVKIASFIRDANFYEMDHSRFTPYINDAYAWEEKNPNTKLLNTLRLGHVNLLIAGGDRTEAVRLLQEILHSKESISVKDSVSVYTFLFDIYTNVRSFSKAWEVLKIRDNILSHTNIKSHFLNQFKKIRINNLAVIYYETKDYNNARIQYKKLLVFAQKENDLHFEAGALNNIGFTYLKKNKPDSAIVYFQQSFEVWKKHLAGINSPTIKDSSFLDLVNGNIGQAYNDKNEYQTAIPLLINDIETNYKTAHYSGIVNGLNELSISYLGLGRPKKALELLDSASNLIKTNQLSSGYVENCENKIKVYDYEGNTKQAYRFYKELVAYKDSIEHVENTNMNAILQVVYEVEQKNKEIDNQKTSLIRADANAEIQQGKQQYLVIVVLLMLVAVIILIINSLQRKKRVKKFKEKSQQIKEQNNIIEKALLEKETLLKEIHHRVKNNLQLISGMLELQSSKINDDSVREIMEQGQNRIKSMALIHQQLYESEDLGEIDFRKYVIQLTNDIIITVNDTNKNIGIVLDIIDFLLDINTAVPMGLIINELVVNAFKHGFLNKKEGTITITLKALEDEYYQLTIYDNGNGLPANFDINNTNSLGLRLVKGLSRQIGGSCEFKNGTGTTGTTVIIKFRNDNN